MQTNNFKRIFQLWIFRSWIVRILILLIATSVGGYYWWALPNIDRAISDNYFKYTGHHLAHNKIQVHLFKCNASVSQLKDSVNLWKADRIAVDVACWQSIRQRTAIVNSIAIQNLSVNALQSEKGQWSFDDVLVHLAAMPKTPESKEQKSSAETPVIIHTVSLIGTEINSNVPALNNLKLNIKPLDLIITHIDLKTKANAHFVLESTINTKTSLNLNGDIKLADLSGKVMADLKGLPVVWADPIVKSLSELDLLAGTLDSTAQINLKAGMPDTLLVNGHLASFKVRPTTMDQDAVKWKNLTWKDAAISLAEKSVNIPEVVLTEFDSQFIITKDRTTNIQAMLKKPVAEAAPVSDQTQKNKTSATNKTSAKNKTLTAQTKQSSSVTATAPTTNATVNAAPANAPNSDTSSANAWKFAIQTFKIENAAIGFYDQSLTPSFMVIVQQFSGEVHQISNQPNQVADFKLVGNVDGYAPVNLEGKANLFIPQPQLEALFSFQKMDMGAFSPYSAEYAGWRIKKGLLSVDLNYHYDQGKILGKNHVVIDHLEFGEKVRSPHLIDIPLRLGLFLLTDEKGIAVLDAEITGDPKDPKFNVKAVLWRAFTNTMKKIVTSPFRFLSSLINSKEDLGRVSFTPGDSQLSEKTIEKLKLLQQALLKRKQLKLSIKATYDLNKDLQALREEQVKSQLQKSGVTPADIIGRTALWAQKVDELYQASVTQTLATNQTSTINQTAASNQTAVTNQIAATEQATDVVNSEQKYQLLIQKETVLDERLHQLAHERAQAVKQYFVLQLAMPSELFLLDTEIVCNKSNPCNSSDVIFTIEE